jgi:hypothetical protein
MASEVVTRHMCQWNPGLGWTLNSWPRPNISANGTGAIKKAQGGAQNNNETSPTPAATRGSENVRNRLHSRPRFAG